MTVMLRALRNRWVLIRLAFLMPLAAVAATTTPVPVVPVAQQAESRYDAWRLCVAPEHALSVETATDPIASDLGPSAGLDASKRLTPQQLRDYLASVQGKS